MQFNSSNKQTFKSLGDVVLRRNKNINENVFKEVNIRELRTSVILFVSAFLFLFIFVPWCIAYIFYKFYPDKLTLVYLLSVHLMVQLNSMINPILIIRTIKDADVILSRCAKVILCPIKEKGTAISTKAP